MKRTLSTIQVEEDAGWSAQPYITLDIDWAHDEVLADSIDLVEAHGVPATWFVTHPTPLLDRLRANPDFELGVHPNFNPLLAGDSRLGRDAAEVLDRLLEIVPEAKAVRSHSTTQNSGLLDLFSRRGLSHECNSFIPFQSGMTMKPWRLWNGLTRIPYFWEDDVACLYGPEHDLSMQALLKRDGIKVFDFHPVHVFLNTEDMARYEQTRELHRRPAELRARRCPGIGTRSHFLELLQLASQAAGTKAGSA